jgi:translation initiation factor IF-2
LEIDLAEKKGIRVNVLAKELGIEPKTILAKMRNEGIPNVPTNSQSTISVGLAESVREWFSGGGVATAVETAPPIKAKKQPVRAHVRKMDHPHEHDEATEDETPGETHRLSIPEPVKTEDSAPSVGLLEAAAPELPEAGVTTVTQPVEETPPVVAHVAHPPEPETPLVQEAPAKPEAPAPSLPPASLALPPKTPLAEPEAIVMVEAPPAPVTPVAHKPVTGPPSVTTGPTGNPPPHRGPSGSDGNRPARPTITLGPTRGGSVTVERKPVSVAPQLNATMLKPASIQGPRVIRVEKPDMVQAPRPTRRPGASGQEGGPGYTTARPTTGRGVKVAEEGDEEARKAGAAKGKANTGRSTRRGTNEGRRGQADEKLREFSEADLAEKKIRLANATGHRRNFEVHLDISQRRGTHVQAKTGVQRGEPIEIEEPITVKSLSAVLGIKASDIVRKLFLQGVPGININSGLDHNTAEAIALEYGVELTVAERSTLEEKLLAEFESREPHPENMRPRPPVVTILGHVDHGKTSLLDKIRSANVAAGEAGGITQHTAAWVVTLGEGDQKRTVTFIDTPGHQAFTSMRARGAQVTDVVVLVVAAVEGVMPQTIESINHARAAGVPIVVAMNKIDRPDANPEMVLGQLAAQGLNPVEWGGDTEVVRTSATTGQGIPELIELLDYQSQLLELKADPTAPARGTVIESRVDAGLGPVATVLVQDGTLKVGDAILSGPGYGRLRTLLNDRLESVPTAGPSTPVIVSGLSELPAAGDKFFVVNDADRARDIAEERSLMARQKSLAGRNVVTTGISLMDTIREGEIKTINLIIKGDVQGSVETLTKTVTDQNTDEVRVRVIHSAVGGINESDVELADASGAVIIGFHVIPDEAARAMAEQRHVELRLYTVIYEIFDDLKKALSGMLEPEVREKLHGHAEIRQVFKVSKIGNIAGCFVTDGHIQRGSKIRLTRGGIVVSEDLSIETLRRLKDDVREVKSGFECGIKLAGYDDIKVGDVMEAYIRETFQRTL